MTREEIMSMPAGPDLDRLVADALGGGNNTRDFTCQHCFDDRDGWNTFHDVFCCNTCGRTTPIQELPYLEFSTEIHYAFHAWEAMRHKADYVSLIERGGDSGCWRESGVRVTNPGDSAVRGNTIWADTVPLAICRAFLIWKMEEGK